MKLLAQLGFTPTEFNTNNAWGFGGGVGTSWTRGNIEIRIGKAYYRHAPPNPFITLTNSNVHRMDLTKRQLKEYLTNLK